MMRYIKFILVVICGCLVSACSQTTASTRQPGNATDVPAKSSCLPNGPDTIQLKTDALIDYCRTGDIRWTYSLPPNTRGGLEFQVVGTTIYAYLRNNILAINAHDGTILWTYSVTLALQVAHLQPAHNTIYLEMREADPVTDQFRYATISALDIQTGKQRWEYIPPAAMPITYYLGADDATGVVFVLQGSENFFQGKDDRHSGKLLALQEATGAILWQDTGDPSMRQIVSSAGIAYYLDWTGLSQTVIARRVSTGQVMWQKAGFTENSAVDALTNQAIVVDDDTGMTMLNPADGTRIAHISIPLYSTNGPIYQPSLIANGMIYVMPYDQQSLTAYAMATGAQRWSATLVPTFNFGSAMYKTLRATDAIVTVSTAQDIVALAVQDGHQMWAIHHAGRMVINTACASFFLIDYTDDGSHWLRELIKNTDGTVVWQQQGDQHNLSGLGGPEMTQLSDCP